MVSKLTILTLLVVLILAVVGCQSDAGNSKIDQGVEPVGLYYSALQADSSTDINQFESQLKDFYHFSTNFFRVWSYHIGQTDLMLEKFNNPATGGQEKLAYSEMLLEKYQQFHHDISQISPPPEALKAYQYALNTVSLRILFFEEYKGGNHSQELFTIEEKAYLYEKLFWEEMDRIYSYFNQAAKDLGIENSKKLDRL